MKWKRLVVCAALLAACEPNLFIRTDYAGDDAGVVVVGFGAKGGTKYANYWLMFRRQGEPQDPDNPAYGHFQYSKTTPWKGYLDYHTHEERGVVVVAFLPPGQYEVYDFRALTSSGMGSHEARPTMDFSIPFTVNAGRVTYLGNYQGRDVAGKNLLGWTVTAGTYFAVENRVAADVELARMKTPDMPLEVDVATPAREHLPVPYFIPHEMAAAIDASAQP